MATVGKIIHRKTFQLPVATNFVVPRCLFVGFRVPLAMSVTTTKKSSTSNKMTACRARTTRDEQRSLLKDEGRLTHFRHDSDEKEAAKA